MEYPSVNHNSVSQKLVTQLANELYQRVQVENVAEQLKEDRDRLESENAALRAQIEDLKEAKSE